METQTAIEVVSRWMQSLQFDRSFEVGPLAVAQVSLQMAAELGSFSPAPADDLQELDSIARQSHSHPGP